MNSKTFIRSLALATGLFVTAPLFAGQGGIQFPAPSPTCTLKQRVGLTDIEIVYSRPGVKGRQIFGALVPYGQVWRTGANQATKITFSTDVKINGKAVPAGTYGLFTIPGEKDWTIIISKGSAQWGSYQYNEKDDLIRVTSTAVPLDFSVETFIIDFNEIRDESASMNLIWEKVFVPIKLEVDLTSKLVPQIESAMSGTGENKPYYQAAMFYYDHDLDLKKAKEWINAAVKQRETFYIVHLQAKILAKTGDKEGALAAAKRSMELSKEAKDSSYMKQNEDLIASLK
jgi:DUF2911 family protein